MIKHAIKMYLCAVTVTSHYRLIFYLLYEILHFCMKLTFQFFYKIGRFFYDTYFAYKMRNFAIDRFFTFNCLYRNSCSKSAIVTAIFNERAEILPRDHNCFILCLKVCLKMSILEYPFSHSQSASCGHN